MGVEWLPDGCKPEMIEDSSLTQSIFVDELMNALKEGVSPDRLSYTKNSSRIDGSIEDCLSYWVNALMTMTSEEKQKISASFSDYYNSISDKSKLDQFALSRKLAKIKNAIIDGYDDNIEEIQELLAEILDDPLKNGFDNEKYNKIKKMWPTIVNIMLGVMRYDYLHRERDDVGFELVGTFRVEF